MPRLSPIRSSTLEAYRRGDRLGRWTPATGAATAEEAEDAHADPMAGGRVVVDHAERLRLSGLLLLRPPAHDEAIWSGPGRGTSSPSLVSLKASASAASLGSLRNSPSSATEIRSVYPASPSRLLSPSPSPSPSHHGQRAVLGAPSVLRKSCLGASGKSPLFAARNGLHGFLRSPHLDRGEVHSIHLNSFASQVNNKVVRHDDKQLLFDVASKCHRLRTLEVAGLRTAVRDEFVTSLGMCPHLQHLDISQTSASARALVMGINKLPMLSTLVCRNCDRLFSEASVEEGADWRCVLLYTLLRKRSVRRVDLSGNTDLCDAILVGGVALLNPPTPSSDLEPQEAAAPAEESPPSAAAGETIVTTPTAASNFFPTPRLEATWKALDLGRCNTLTDAGTMALIDVLPCLEEVRLLGVDTPGVTDASLTLLGKRAGRRLKKLDITGMSQLQGRGLHAVVEACPNIASLHISGLDRMRGLPSVTLVSITRGLPNLDSLDVAGNPAAITPKFIFALIDRVPTLRCLNIVGCPKMTTDLVEEVQKTKPGLHITYSPTPVKNKRDMVLELLRARAAQMQAVRAASGGAKKGKTGKKGKQKKKGGKKKKKGKRKK